MKVSREGLEDELRRLRKGRGVRTIDIGLLSGPALRALCRITAADDHQAIRRKVQAVLEDLCARIPADLGLVATASFALKAETPHRFLSDRLQWVGAALSRDERTIRRYAEDALRCLIDEALATPANDPGPQPPGHALDWYVDSCNALFRLDGPGVEVVEERTIVATVDGLRDITAAISLPRHPSGVDTARNVEADVLYGGRIVGRDRRGLSHLRWKVEFPQPLPVGGRRSFAMRYVIPPEQPMAPHYFFFPLHPCRRFQVAIRYAPDQMPKAARRFSMAPQRLLDDLALNPLCLLDDETMGGEVVEADRFGEVHIEFVDLSPGYGYGVAWLPGDSDRLLRHDA